MVCAAKCMTVSTVVLRKQPGHQRTVADIADDEFARGHRLPESPAQIVEDDDPFRGLAQLTNDMTADVPGTAGDQNGSL